MLEQTTTIASAARRFVLAKLWRIVLTVRTAAQLEWQSQGNWTNPVLFLLLLIVKPLVAALVLVFMYWVVSGFHSHGAFFSFLIVGSAAWSFVEQIVSGLPRAVLEDREQYAMLKYIYITPQSFVLFLIGRSMPRLLAACISFVTTLAFGILLLGVPIHLQQVNYALLLFASLLGFAAITAIGVAVAGLSLTLKRGSWELSNAMVGALYLIAGTIFPISILPAWIEHIALVLPIVYWLELTRRALLGDAVGASFPLANTEQIIVWLLMTTCLTCVACGGIFRLSEHVARERGQIDRATGD